MGMFNSIYADLRCPEKQEIGKDAEIQIKWQHPALFPDNLMLREHYMN